MPVNTTAIGIDLGTTYSCVDMIKKSYAKVATEN